MNPIESRREALRAACPEPRLRARDIIPILLAIVATLVVYIAFAATIGSENSGYAARDGYYNRLVDGFREGHLYLDKPVPPLLLNLPNPYDPAANGPVHGPMFSPECCHDLSFYRGKFYLYFSPVPALLLFLPYRVITGGYISQQYACAILAGLAFLCASLVLLLAWRRYFRVVGSGWVGLGVLAMGLAPLTPILLQRPDVYEVPICCAYFLTMLSIVCLWAIAHRGQCNAWWAAALSLCVGLAIGSRPSDIGLGVLLLVPLATAWRAGAPDRDRDGRRRVRGLIAAVAPITAIGVALLWYNYARFGKATEFGFRYQLTHDASDLASFAFSNVPFNAWMYLLHFPGWTWHFPFAGPWQSAWAKPASFASVENPVGLLTAVPLVAFAAALIFSWKRLAPPFRLVLAGVIWIALCNTALLLTFFGSVARYEMAFAPSFVLLAIIGVFCLESARTPTWGVNAATALRLGWVGAAVFSVGYVGLFAVRLRGAEYGVEGTSYLISQHNPDMALRKYNQALACDPDLTDVRRLCAIIDANAGKVPEAITILAGLVKKNPKDATSYNTLGQVVASEPQRAGQAIWYFRRAIAIAPQFADAHANLAAVLARDPAQRSAAIAECRAAIQYNPDLWSARALLAELLAQDPRELAATIAAYRDLFSLPATPAQAMGALRAFAALCVRAGEWSDALNAYHRILELNPTDAQAEGNLGAVLCRDPAQREQAVRHLRRAIQLNPDFAEAHNNLGYALASDPRTREEAVKEFEQALALRPNYPEAKNNLQRLLASVQAKR